MPAMAGCSCRSRTSSFCRATARMHAEAVLDRLGGGAWQSRKAKLKRRLLDMAGALIRIAAERQMHSAPVLIPTEGLYGEFSARFPYEETDDQQTAIDMVMEDLSERQADGSADLRRCRLRQDRSRAARGLRCSARGPAGGGGGADHAAGAPAFQDVLAALRRPARQDPAGVATGRQPRSSPRPRRALPTARSTSWSARTRCSARRFPSRTWAC